MMNPITIVSWNICGLCDLNRKHIIRNWVASLTKPPDILCLQELKANHFRLEQALEFILPSSHKIIAPPNGICGGTTILLAQSLLVVSSGIILDNQAAWVKIKGP